MCDSGAVVGFLLQGCVSDSELSLQLLQSCSVTIIVVVLICLTPVTVLIISTA